jgi:hypothetical protein
MPYEAMCKEMIHQIRVLGGTESQVDAYLTDYSIADENSERPLSCPSCYLKGDTKRLNHLDDQNGVHIVRCTYCRKFFEFVSPN